MNTKAIRRAQISAGEDAVVADLQRKGLVTTGGTSGASYVGKDLSTNDPYDKFTGEPQYRAILPPHLTRDDVAALVNAAVAVERDRCALVAVRWGEAHKPGQIVDARNAASNIVRAIKWATR